MDLFDLILRYAVVPVSGFVWAIHVKLQLQSTQIAVIQSQIEASKDAHDRELRDMKKTIDAIFAKLDSIEAALRK